MCLEKLDLQCNLMQNRRDLWHFYAIGLLPVYVRQQLARSEADRSSDAQAAEETHPLSPRAKRGASEPG